jgi:LAGLIDADG-like domain
MEENERLLFSEAPRNFFKWIVDRSSWEELQKDANVSGRTLRSWRAGETSMPASIAIKWSSVYGVELPSYVISLVSERRSRAGQVGGRARQEIWGNIGTNKGRSLGGKNAIETHRKNPTSPFVSRQVIKPKHSADFAELVGILLGDGTLTKYQFVISSNSLEEKEYAKYLSDLIQRIFSLTPSILFHPTVNAIRTICSSAQVIQHLQTEGLQLGNKVKHQVGIPLWIKENTEYAHACLRGLIDTDGCVYFDRHKIKGKQYSSLGIDFANASVPILNFVESTWKDLGFSPTRSGIHVRLRRKEEVFAYSKLIGFSNPKHARKIKV